jgi:formamidopyrimidine-DNA glycosylase
MPELPEVEQARRALETALDRTIAAVDDTDDWICRPHRPGDLAGVLVGGRLTGAHRRGKSMWCETEGGDGTPGPELGLHLGMGGRLVITGPGGSDEVQGGDPVDATARSPEWDRFTVDFADGGRLRLFDKRRLARVRLDPDVDALGPDALDITADQFVGRVGRGKAPVKARLLDQSVLAGVGNLLADETLWQARIAPATPVGELGSGELTRLHGALEKALDSAVRQGGVHTGEMIGSRRAGAHCPRCGGPMGHGTVGGRTTWWCTVEQPEPAPAG